MEPALPVLPRLDRLDRLLELLEEKHGKSRRYESITTNDDDNNNDYKKTSVDHPNCKTLLSALDDVHHKGTLIDRLTILENHVLQLSLDIEDGSTSRSSSSTAYTTKEEKEVPIDKCDTKSSGKGRRRRVHFKRMRWMSMGC
ncbi:uncharacterized protein LOC112513533 [Cynara cardunculus var. scolymus]|uniref:Uncharacterized protein n=1 Tax=Cynara cardunculus var. scolymus TaxID=59895 RepID=A0A103Y5R7_CYNCS|nr:uncharacterized protein LOC112513533 [Cynara cardunculus var. scolymus]KVI03019.1 hypothetical protein Ccrd_018687 [Cynara cardunculus var. scolymus]